MADGIRTSSSDKWHWPVTWLPVLIRTVSTLRLMSSAWMPNVTIVLPSYCAICRGGCRFNDANRLVWYYFMSAVLSSAHLLDTWPRYYQRNVLVEGHHQHDWLTDTTPHGRLLSVVANSAFHPSGVGKWVPASAGKAKAGMVHSVSGCTLSVQVKLRSLENACHTWAP